MFLTIGYAALIGVPERDDRRPGALMFITLGYAALIGFTVIVATLFPKSR
jgi:hypothetical protein